MCINLIGGLLARAHEIQKSMKNRRTATKFHTDTLLVSNNNIVTGLLKSTMNGYSSICSIIMMSSFCKLLHALH